MAKLRMLGRLGAGGSLIFENGMNVPIRGRHVRLMRALNKFFWLRLHRGADPFVALEEIAGVIYDRDELAATPSIEAIRKYSAEFNSLIRQATPDGIPVPTVHESRPQWGYRLREPLVTIDLGMADQSLPPDAREIEVPRCPSCILRLGQWELVEGRLANDWPTAFVVVRPLVGTTHTDWIVQQTVVSDGLVHAKCRFGEEQDELGGLFAVCILATDKPYTPGDRIARLPGDQHYSAVQFVRRTQ